MRKTCKYCNSNLKVKTKASTYAWCTSIILLFIPFFNLIFWLPLILYRNKVLYCPKCGEEEIILQHPADTKFLREC
ncbi:MAG: hypothetical protein FJ216_07390 [Ignavibacteria bacterium]|nr:hypothetical protein [Ignavibacteria bacterium]